MVSHLPKVVVLAGPNGVGKSTSAAKLLIGTRQVREFVNASACRWLSGRTARSSSCPPTSLR